ncbi:MerR family transcriptional regulator [Lacinutrix neustonica]|uniref:MerR family transcriptional regulator n=1 Tax=Lacinutrix neustonica TaxID=2980107 RepID=A0A9E8MUX2_9FLAO|nr:MerR family transcriptional regulator [Lacinutrix neustonica]WAC02008.1 MerR family transcriptional regulator [Lacinutrix neustonica]
MNNIKTKFSIRDLENLSGIKAHTIRIWEKRYNLFEPNRTDTNIRYYSLSSLQKLLNISFLNKNGYKVSKIASLESQEIPTLVKEIALNKDSSNHAINLFKVAMLNFDKGLFLSTFNNLVQSKSISEIFYTVFVPLLEDIGILWQTDTITPAHEHFIFELIKQKILVHTDNISNASQDKHTGDIYVLFLPDNEIHELGLLFINYELTLRGLHSIYLGQSVPIDSLKYITDYYNKIIYISSFTIKPEKEIINDYLIEFSEKILQDSNHSLHISR